MKKHFGDYRSRLKAAAKHLGIPVEDLAWERDPAIDPALAHLFAAEQRALRGEATHFFIATPELAIRLCELGRFHDPRLLEILADEGMVTGIIHTCGPGADGVLFSWASDRKDALTVADREQHQTGVPDGTLPYHQAGAAMPATRLLFGLALYLNCFPHAVREGFPEFAKHPAHYRRQRCVAIDAVPELTERAGPTPHFRAGHFRVLASERFTHKRWQVVFVSEAFVKGKAKTVCEVQPKPQ